MTESARMCTNGHSNSSDAIFCSQCGTRLPADSDTSDHLIQPSAEPSEFQSPLRIFIHDFPVAIIVGMVGLAALIGFAIVYHHRGSSSNAADTTSALSPQEQCANNAGAWATYIGDNFEIGAQNWVDTVGTQSPVYAPILQDSAYARGQEVQVGAQEAVSELDARIATQCATWTQDGMVIPPLPVGTGSNS